MDLGQDANSGLQPVMPQQPITSGTGPIILAPTEKKSKRWLVIIGVVLFLIAIGTGVAALVLTKSKPVVADVTKAYIEYFVYGTEGENQVNSSTFEIDIDEFAVKKKLESISSQESSEYFDKLLTKFNVVESVGKGKIDADLLKYHRAYLEYYKAIMQTLASDLLINAYNDNSDIVNIYSSLPVEETTLLAVIYNNLNDYAKDQYGFYTKVKEVGCLINGEVDYNCIWGNNEDSVLLNDSTVMNNLGHYSEVVYEFLTKELTNIYEQGGGNE